MAIQGIAMLVLLILGLVAAALIIAFVMVPLFKGLAILIGLIFKGIAWFITHIFEFVFGVIGDTIRFIGGIPVYLIFALLSVSNVVIGRWSAAGHYARSASRECRIGLACLYRVLVRRPLKLVMLHGLLEGVEQRVPEAMGAAPTSDSPSKRTGQFDGYTIVGSLRGGGSGAKLYIAEPDPRKMANFPAGSQRVVIKSFAIAEGSTLPQIVRESRALESARQLGLVLEHGMDNNRFYYVMPYHPGDHLGIITRQMHAESGEKGLTHKQMMATLNHMRDLVATLSTYHAGGLWHKDVKPENVIVHDGRANLVDLGLVTPLRSAMTLTTHGTEYFRDPELVRQALRGVKVHQIDCTKFDVYAAGAVLYFMLENTFPAHGALSRFTKTSPEAVKWIVRRSMAEYNQRYESADEMLADLNAVLTAREPALMKPAELPSMRGETPPPPQEAEMHPGATFASARTPVPPAEPEKPEGADTEPEKDKWVDAKVFAWGVTRDENGLKIGRLGGEKPMAHEHAKPGRRPDIRVSNWWTGSYVVDGDDKGDGAAATPGAPAAQAASAHVASAGRRAAGEMRKSAREQVKSARARARQIRKSASQRRHAHVRADAERQPSVGLIVAALVVIAGVVGFGSLVYKWQDESAGGSPSGWAMAEPDLRIDDSGRMPLILAVDVSDPDEDGVARKIRHIVENYEDDGRYTVVTPIEQADKLIVDLFEEWTEHKTDAIDRALEDALELRSLYGVLHVYEVSGKGRASDRIGSTLIYAERDGAENRRRPEAVTIAMDKPLLVVNDHPVASDPEVATRIESLRAMYQSMGVELADDAEAEASIRNVLPVAPASWDVSLSPLVGSALSDHGLAGVIVIDAGPGEAAPAERLRVTLIVPEEYEALRLPASGQTLVVPGVDSAEAVPPMHPEAPAPGAGDQVQADYTIGVPASRRVSVPAARVSACPASVSACSQ